MPIDYNDKIVYPTGITLDSESISLTEAATVQLKATITPSDATKKTITWSSSDTSVATVTNRGLVTAVAEGTATITATTVNDFTASVTITVKEKEIPIIENGIYFDKPSDWGSTIYAYMWDDSTQTAYNGAWPGTKIDNLGNDIYGFSYKTDNANMKIIFKSLF